MPLTEPPIDSVRDIDADTDGVLLEDAPGESVLNAEAVALGVSVGEGDGALELDGVMDAVSDDVPAPTLVVLGEVVLLTDADALVGIERFALGVVLRVTLGVGIALSVDDSDGVALALSVVLGVAVGVMVGVALTVALAVELGVAVGVGVTEAVTDGVDDGDGQTILRTTQPALSAI